MHDLPVFLNDPGQILLPENIIVQGNVKNMPGMYFLF